MSNTSKTLKVLGVIIAALAIYGAYNYPIAPQAVVTGISSPGVNNSSAKLYTSTVAPATNSGTTTSIYNSDGTDRGIIYGVTYCTGVGTSQTYLTGTGLAAFSLVMSTSTSAVDAKTNANSAFALTIATSSPWEEQFTSSLANGAVSGVWPSGTYLNITFNATNTAACTVGVGTVSL